MGVGRSDADFLLRRLGDEEEIRDMMKGWI